MSAQHDPIITKVNDSTERLNRRRLETSETSETIIQERNAFFDRLALLNAGALTFSVTLFASLSVKNPKGILILNAAWICLLVALAACLVRNLSHQHYRSSHAAASMAKAEVDYSDARYEAISANKMVGYTDSTEPYDKQREIERNRENRTQWEQKIALFETRRNRNWKLVRITEWIAAGGMTIGFLLLIIFATVNTRG